MKIICSLVAKSTAASEQFMPLEEPESRRVWELYMTGTLKEIYLRTDEIGAVIILNCGSKPEAETAISSLPMVKAGLFDLSYIQLGEWSEMTRMLGEHQQPIPNWYPSEAAHSI